MSPELLGCQSRRKRRAHSCRDACCSAWPRAQLGIDESAAAPWAACRAAQVTSWDMACALSVVTGAARCRRQERGETKAELVPKGRPSILAGMGETKRNCMTIG